MNLSIVYNWSFLWYTLTAILRRSLISIRINQYVLIEFSSFLKRMKRF